MYRLTDKVPQQMQAVSAWVYEGFSPLAIQDLYLDLIIFIKIIINLYHTELFIIDKYTYNV